MMQLKLLNMQVSYVNCKNKTVKDNICNEMFRVVTKHNSNFWVVWRVKSPTMQQIAEDVKKELHSADHVLN